MSDISIGRIVLVLHGIPGEIAQAALDGLGDELARRLGLRAIDPLAWREAPPAIRLPALAAVAPLDAASLRACIAEGLAAFLGSAAAEPPAEVR